MHDLPDDDDFAKGAAAVQVKSEEEALEPQPEPDTQGAFKAFQVGQLAMDRGDFHEAARSFTEAVEKDWTVRMYAEWLEEAANRIIELEGGAAVSTEDEADGGTPPPPAADEVGAPPRPATPEKRTPNPAASAAFKATLAERHLKLGLEAQRVGNAAEATRNLESAARLAPDDERIARALKNVKQHFGDVEDTEEESSVRAAADVMRKRNAERYYLRGLKARRMDMWDEAIACFEGAVRTDPKNPDYAQALKEAHEKRTASAPEPRKKRGAAEVVGPSLKDQLLANSRFAVGVAAILALGILVTA